MKNISVSSFKKDLLYAINKSTCCFKTISYIKEFLDSFEFKELKEKEDWSFEKGKYYVIRNESSIVAFEINDLNNECFKIITTHSDTPGLLLKPDGEYLKNGFVKYNVMPYGGLLNYGWLDVPLSLSGRVIYKDGSKLKSKIIDLEEPFLIVPSVAIHQNDSANTNLDLNMQIDLQPIMDIGDLNNVLDMRLKDLVNKEIIGFDLYAYNISKPYIIGLDNDLLISPRIDNITSVYSGLNAFIKSNSNSIKVFCSFNSEEIGNLTCDGADSNFLRDVLIKISNTLNISVNESFSKSMILSSDNTHAVHPNHDEYKDDTGNPYLGKGFTIIKEMNSTTNSISLSVIKLLCEKGDIKFQIATTKNDMSTGSTLSGITLRHVGILSADVGVAQLAMHSATEVCSVSDIYELYKMMTSFYNTDFILDEKTVSFI